MILSICRLLVGEGSFVELGQRPGQGQSDAAALLVFRLFQAVERIEDIFLFAFRDQQPVVDYGDGKLFFIFLYLHVQEDIPIRIFDGICQQIIYDLGESLPVDVGKIRAFRYIAGEGFFLLFHHRKERLQEGVQPERDIRFYIIQFETPAFCLPEIKQLVAQVEQLLGIFFYDPQILLGGDCAVAGTEYFLQRCFYQCQRRTYLVGDEGEELDFCIV